ncbi:GNAT family N-acetyltransferase [Microbacterium ulmi]|uniref:GNAT family N-acetyltransferase n=1 Tax=Microbacterium ulmi TaxID=179095 RepID=A0A7Y2LY48_9MICO|nr:GNAT family N-acetyltransferase [Microbacterium ulmi]NII71250.1 GNAT superfamily N-acetyltransferase [Microbacterium ulmi]NNH02554.1 GNAT family N-acetyltransferase [Microbacterium ulmi]
MTITTDLVIRDLRIPASMDDRDSADFAEMTRVRNAVLREVSGHDDHAVPPHELLPHYHNEQYERQLVWLLELDAEVIGRAGLGLPLEEGSTTAFWFIDILHAFHGRGFGSAALALVERTARQESRSVLQSWAEHASEGAPRLAAPTGFGTIPRDHAARFFLRHGYALEQVERCSALDLRADPAHLERLLAEATAAASGYRVVQWLAPTPQEHVAGYAWMKSRMSTDAPSAALEFDEEVWDAARIAAHDAQYVDAGSTIQVTAAQHVATGELVAFNELVIGNDRTRASHQEDTLVLREHRGHRLGMLVKCAGLLSWRRLVPDSPRVITYNAEENRPMLDINEAIGFVPIAYEGAWKKTVDAAAAAGR